MRKIEYVLSGFLFVSLGLNTYLVINMDRLIRDDFEEIISAKKVSFVQQDLEKIDQIKIARNLNDLKKKYKLSLGRTDPFKPLIEERRQESGSISSILPDKNVVKAVPEVERPNFVVRGILKGKYNEVVILEKPEKEESFVVEKGKEVDGYQIIKVDIDNNTITLRKNNRDFTLKLVGDR